MCNRTHLIMDHYETNFNHPSSKAKMIKKVTSTGNKGRSDLQQQLIYVDFWLLSIHPGKDKTISFLESELTSVLPTPILLLYPNPTPLPHPTNTPVPWQSTDYGTRIICKATTPINDCKHFPL